LGSDRLQPSRLQPIVQFFVDIIVINRTFNHHLFHARGQAGYALAASITKAASKQTYSTILLLVDRDRVPNAFQAYAYFRWLDDRLDQSAMDQPDRMAFVERQLGIMDRCYLGQPPTDLSEEERLLADLIHSDPSKTSGLYAYIHNMMNVMAFDAARRGRWITQAELTNYTLSLATAVTEALHYFIGYRRFSPHGDLRYLAVNAAHITHMLRDTLDDAPAGYFNIPKEVLETHGVGVQEVGSEAYRAWVMSRVLLARKYFQAGKLYLIQVECLRCRIAGFAYVARFERILDAIESDGYVLRRDYPERNSLASGFKMAWSILSWAFIHRQALPFTHTQPVR